jgi:hypothetical protein
MHAPALYPRPHQLAGVHGPPHILLLRRPQRPAVTASQTQGEVLGEGEEVVRLLVDEPVEPEPELHY